MDVIRVMELLQLGDDVYWGGLEDSNHTQFNASFKKAVMCKMNQLMKLKVVSIVEIKLCRFQNLFNTFTYGIHLKSKFTNELKSQLESEEGLRRKHVRFVIEFSLSKMYSSSAEYRSFRKQKLLSKVISDS